LPPAPERPRGGPLATPVTSGPVHHVKAGCPAEATSRGPRPARERARVRHRVRPALVSRSPPPGARASPAGATRRRATMPLDRTRSSSIARGRGLDRARICACLPGAHVVSAPRRA